MELNMSHAQSITSKSYSMKEKALLATLIETYKDMLESKKTDSITNSIKNEAWESITEEYNTYDVTIRTPGQLKKCWENMKYKARKADRPPPEANSAELLKNESRLSEQTESISKYLLKMKRLLGTDEEKELRLIKINESIEQQEELHKLKMEVAQAEKEYWIAKKKLLHKE